MTTFGESLYGGTLRCYKIIATEADLPSAGGNIDASSINIDNKWEIRLDASSNFILENTAISINSIIGDAHSGKITLYDYNLEDLENVTITDLSNGQILKYNSTTSVWENVTDPSGVETLNDLTDVTITNAGNGQILQYNDSNEAWENATLPTGVETLNDLTDVTITNLANGQILKYNTEASTWENVILPSGVETLNDLTDVRINNVGNGQILKYNSTASKWENVTDPSGVETLNDLTDVTITNLANGQILMYNDFDEQWQNSLLPTGITLLSELTDVAITNVGNGQILIYNDNNEAWENITPTYLDGANLPDNFLIKSVNNQAVSSHLFSTATTTTNQLEFSVPTDPLFNVLSGVIQTTTNALGTIRRMNLATSYIANTRGLTITETGRVGIGILNPEEDLEVDGSIQIDSAVTARLKFQQSGQNPHALGEIDGEQDGTNGGDLQFYTKLDGGNVTEKLRINNIGAVGIGGANYGTSKQVMVSNGSNNLVSWENQRFYEGQPFNYFPTGGADGVARADFTNNTAVAFHGTTYGSSKFLDILYSGIGIEIGSYNPAAPGSWRINYQILQLTGAGNWAVYDWISGTTTILVPPSDDRVKTHEEIFNGETYINYIKQIVPKKYKRYNFVLTEEEEQILEAGGDPFEDRRTGDAVKDSEFNPKIEYGVIAQDIHKISGLEDIVTVGTDERPWRVDYRSIDTITLGAVKGLIERIETLEARLALLEAQRVN